ncbi:MAG: ATP-binding cassette domain-containing protein, partial [Chloroflexota bacterium]
MTTLEVRHLVKKFHGSERSAVNDVSFELGADEILALVGPSGCGKTTTLRLIAGLERPDAGLIRLNDRVV